MRQRGFKCAARSATARSITIKTENHIVRLTQQLLYVRSGTSGTERSHRLLETILREGNHVHITLGDQDIIFIAYGLTRLEQTVELTALLKQRRFR